MRSSRAKATGEAVRPGRIAIVGGGCAALAAAWKLSRLNGYEVDVYEAGWRLGGKGASGRDEEGRILEHGLHIWLGFYENAFRMMRECYAEVEGKGWGPRQAAGERLAHGSLADAFFPEPHIGVMVRDAAEDFTAKWAIWSGHLPPAKGMPGEPLDPETNPFTVVNYLARCYELLKTLMLSAVGPGDAVAPGQGAGIDLDYACDPARTPREIVDWSARVLRGGVVSAASLPHQVVLVLQKLLETADVAPQLANMRTFQLGNAILEQARKLLEDVVATDPSMRRKLEIIDIVIAIAVGLYRNRVLFNRKGFDAINAFDYRDWLKRQGANPKAVDSEFITGIYDLTFAYENGTERKLAAGVALRGALRMFFTYRGSMFWRMRSGMGDAVFAPLYKVLLGRNVRFHFRHTLQKVELETIADQRYVKALEFTTAGDRAGLDALQAQALDDFGCWPDTPRRFGAAGQDPATFSVERGKDFDAVILATGADDFVAIGRRSDLFSQLPKHWDEMRENMATAATQSAQVWLSADLEQLGWQRGSGIMTAMAAPYETWADMTHTLGTEKTWRAVVNGGQKSVQDSARSVAYFCAVVPDGSARSPEDATRKATDDLDQLLKGGIAPFWPGAFTGRKTAHHLVVSKHVQANWAGSDRYTLSLPGQIQYRISPLDRSVMNMTIAGDWTASGLDAGCVEGAVMSGMLAAFAISNHGAILHSIVGYDHP